MSMILEFLGTGSAFVPISENYHSNMLLKADNGKILLIDCGSDARHSLGALGYHYRDIDSVYISHFHADHTGGLEWLAFCTYFDEKAKKPTLIIHPSMLPRLWSHVLCGGLQSLEGKNPANIKDYFNILELQDDSTFIWESIKFHLVQTVHVHNGPELLPSYGLFFSTPCTKVFISTDTQFEPDRYMQYYQQADLIFHDCETSKEMGEVHAHFTQLATLDPAIKAKMWLYHYHNVKRFDPIAHGFLGYVKKGQEFKI
jgi:ribonuclease BN (tRNA processing enzyme)